ncbi:hypothetical protein [Tritonibacter scottomollicae]|uniref:hypothetical protein n=1 Tax=Tritonibacter scottomollicae TaxID=483013 RepID=UPI003AA8B02F
MNNVAEGAEIVGKNQLAGRIEPFILRLLERESYPVERIPSADLLTWNRLDLAFKLLFLDLKDRHPALARDIYKEDIRSQTLGTYTEHDNEGKNSFQKYLTTFEEISSSVDANGFDQDVSLIPVSSTGAIFNGSHRVASAIQAEARVACVRTELPIHVCDYRFYQRSGVSTKLIEMAVQEFIEHANDVYLAFLWPSGADNLKRSEEQFANVIYKKKVPLTLNGGRNLLLELYKHMDWIGSRKNGYSGIDQKLIECFPNQAELTILAFQAKSIEEVREIKEKVRAIHKIGFSSVHITDTKEEAVRVSKLVFNENGLHFLNYAKPYKFDLESDITEFRQFVSSADVPQEDIAVDGSFLLALYGVRAAHDLDYLSAKEIECPHGEFEAHDGQLIHHGVGKADLLYDPDYHFTWAGIKFISFGQLWRMKTNRGEQKDAYDVASMSQMLEPDNFKRRLNDLRQKAFFLRLRIWGATRNFVVLSLKKTGLYSMTRRLYWRLME